MIHRIIAAGLLALAVLLAPGLVALAQSAPAAPGTSIDFGPLLNQVVWPILGAVVTAFAGWVSLKVAGWLHLKNADQVRGYLEPALQNALAYGQAKVGKLPLTVDVKNEIVAVGAQFALDHVNDGLKFFGLDSPEAVGRLLSARLEANINAQIPDVTATTGDGPPTTPALAPALAAGG